MDKIDLKTASEIKIMAEGGAKLRRVKNFLAKLVKAGVSAYDIENAARELIKKEGAEVAFTKVPGYSWATCINVNAGIVHGIPSKSLIFAPGDIVSIDVGIYYRGFNTDTSIPVAVEPINNETAKFLEAGKKALKYALLEARAGNYIKDISLAIGSTIKEAGYRPIEALVGHGVGRELHEAPYIPCFVTDLTQPSIKIVPGMVLAVEVMYCLGLPDLVLEKDGWTISTRDGKISALYEETVAVEADGSLVLT